ncbi:MAG TPA: hypothetical protein VMO26_20050 [Vicinamibacterales bacterium]|nr:hypothetical protein [Vicinamibacterales bacterium]
MADLKNVRVAVNGYGVIGKRVAAAVAVQEDMSLAGVSDVVTDWRARVEIVQTQFNHCVKDALSDSRERCRRQ